MITADILRDHQKTILKLFLNNIAMYNIVIGGAGTFKTSTCVLGWFYHCMLNRGQVIYIIGVDHTTTEEIWFSESKKQFGRGEYKIIGSRGNRELHFPAFNSKLLFKQWTKPTVDKALAGFGTGPSVSGYHLLQPDMMDERAETFFGRINQRVRLFSDPLSSNGTSKQKRVLDMNAPSPSHWLYRYFFDQNNDKYLGSEKGIVNIVHIKTTPETSIYSEQEINLFKKQMPDHIYRRFVDGEPAQPVGVIYKNVGYTDSINFDDIKHFSIGFDPGEGDHQFGIVFVGQLSKGQWVVFDELTGKKSTLEDTYRILKDKIRFYGESKLEYIVYDWSAHVYKGYLQSKLSGTHCFPEASRGRYFQVNTGIFLLNSLFIDKTLTIYSKLDSIQKDISNYIWTQNGSQPDKQKYDPHLLDALRYCIIRLMRFRDE